MARLPWVAARLQHLFWVSTRPACAKDHVFTSDSAEAMELLFFFIRMGAEACRNSRGGRETSPGQRGKRGALSQRSLLRPPCPRPHLWYLMRKLLPRSFYLDPPDVVGRKLLGKLVRHRINGQSLTGRIVE